jgi:hypothetical protein
MTTLSAVIAFDHERSGCACALEVPEDLNVRISRYALLPLAEETLAFDNGDDWSTAGGLNEGRQTRNACAGRSRWFAAKNGADHGEAELYAASIVH